MHFNLYVPVSLTRKSTWLREVGYLGRYLSWLASSWMDAKVLWVALRTSWFRLRRQLLFLAICCVKCVTTCFHYLTCHLVLVAEVIIRGLLLSIDRGLLSWSHLIRSWFLATSNLLPHSLSDWKVILRNLLRVFHKNRVFGLASTVRVIKIVLGQSESRIRLMSRLNRL